jgi:hypothetical protein
MLLAETESGQGVIYLTDPQLQLLVRQAQSMPLDGRSPHKPRGGAK